MFLSCKKASELIEKRLLIGLSFHEKIQLMLHKRMCDACTNYSHQSAELDTYIRNNIKNFPAKNTVENVSVSEDYKESILKKLKEV